MARPKKEGALRPLLERFLLWADQCPDIRKAVIEWPQERTARRDGDPDLRITVITDSTRGQVRWHDA